ncbi:MAG TPA: hypothetical protein VIA11_11730 [Acidimicrobiia bacterium]|nr:hypothetical protein [Acidimicrobiia bacterium]
MAIEARGRVDGRRRAREADRLRRLAAGCTVLALLAVAFTFAVAFVHAHPTGTDAVVQPVEAARDGAVAVTSNDAGLDAPSLHALRAEPASRTRTTVFAIVAVGVVVAAATRRRRPAGPPPVLFACALAGPAPGRGPPSSRIA